MTTPAGGNLVGDATINVNANTTAAALAIRGLTRDANGQLRDLRGRFVSEGRLINNSLTTATRSVNRFGEAVDTLRSASLLLSPALIPIAAQAAPIAVGLGAATVAVGAFAAAAAGQVTAISEAAEAEEKYQEAVDEHGATSQKAAEAQIAYVRQVEKMPAATRTAAAALGVLKDRYQEWSDSLASSTMPVATKALQTFSGVFPKLTPLVQGTSRELDRFVTIAAGGVASPGFDRFMASFSDFAVGTLEKANDALIRFTRTLDTGQVSGGVTAFMEYARENGPLVRDTLAKVAEALSNVLQGTANVGPGLLTVVNALAGIVAAVPPGAITVLLQLAIAIKAVKLAAAGAAAAQTAMAAMGVQITAMTTAAAAAPGRLAAVGAAIGALSRTAKLALAGTGIGLLVIALGELAQIGGDAEPEVDKLTTSLGRLGQSGKATGYAAKEFGANFQELRKQIDRVIDPSVAESINNWGADVTGGLLDAGDGTEKFTKSIDAIDSSLAGLVSSGKAKEAAAAIQVMTRGMNKEQLDKFNSGLGDYRQKLADLAFEQDYAAKAQGLFGQEAQATSTKLAEQKLSADGLRRSIQALNDVNRASFDAETKFEAAIDAASESIKTNGATLDVHTDKGRANRDALSAIGAATDDLAAKKREEGGSWTEVTGIYERGRQQLIKNAMEARRTRKEAKALADEILNIPDKETQLKGNLEDLKKKVDKAKKDIKSVPPSKVSQMKGTISDLEKKVKDAKARIKSVPPSKRSELRAGINDLERKVRQAKAALASVRSRSVTITAFVQYKGQSIAKVSAGRMAAGGRVKGYAGGGPIQSFPDGGYVQGPGTPTSDSVLALMGSGATARVADTEYVVRGAAVRRYGVRLFDALNSMQIPIPRTAASIASSAARNVGTVRAERSTAGSVTVVNNLYLTNHGVLGSRMETENWLAKSLDNLDRTGRLPKTLRGA